MSQLAGPKTLGCSFLLITLLHMPGYAAAETLSMAVHKALAANPEVLAERAAVDEAKGALNEAFAGYLPTVSLTALRGRENTDSIQIPDQTYWRQERRVEVNQMLFDGAGVLSRVRSRQHSMLAAGAKAASVSEEIAFKVASAYLDILRNERNMELAGGNIDAHKETLRKVEALYKAGAGLRGDVELATSRLASARVAYFRFQQDLADSKARFTNLVGNSPALPLQPAPTPKLLPSTLNEALSASRVHNPLLHQSQQTLEADRATVREAQSTFIPRVDLEMHASRNYNIDGILGHNHDKQAVLMVSYDIFNGGANLAQVKQAAARREASLQRLEDTYRDVVQEVTVSWDALEAAKAKLPELVTHVHSGERVLADYGIQFKLGKRALFNVLDQENELFQAKIQQVNGEDEILRNQYRLLANMGVLVESFNRA
jgi:outer membrane protein, adhesin transport system